MQRGEKCGEIYRSIFEAALKHARSCLSQVDMRGMGAQSLDLVLHEAEAGEMRGVEGQLQSRKLAQQVQCNRRAFQSRMNMGFDCQRHIGGRSRSRIDHRPKG